MQKLVFILSSLVSLFVLVGCNDDSNKNQPSPQQLEEQANIEKYNAYVSAYNRGTARIVAEIANDLDDLEKIGRNNPPSTVSLSTPDNVIDGLRFFKEAKDEQGSALELEDKVDAIISALSQAEPTAKELKSYIESKGYLADQGKKARELKQKYSEEMEQLGKTLIAFTDYLQEKEAREIKQQFENARSDTTSYYISGLLYYGRESIQDFKSLMAKPQDKDLQTVFEEKINKMAELTANWSKKDLPKFCMVPRQANSYIADARVVLSVFRKGDAINSDGSVNDRLTASYYKALVGKMNATINAMNGDGC